MTNPAQLAEEGGPLIMESADGIYVTAMDGKKYIDGISGATLSVRAMKKLARLALYLDAEARKQDVTTSP